MKIMCESHKHLTPVEATRFFVLYKDNLDPSSSRFWKNYIEHHVYVECEECWKSGGAPDWYHPISRDDYLAALAMEEL